MLERDCFDFALFGMQEISYSLDHFVHFIFAGDTFKQFSFINKMTQDVNSGMNTYTCTAKAMLIECEAS